MRSTALEVRGPTYTLVRREDAVAGALEHAEDDVADGLVASALVVAVACDADDRPRLAAAVLDRELPIGYRRSLLGTFVECLRSSCSRPMATSQPSR